MFNITQAHSSDGTLRYFESVLSIGDYYTGVEVGGTWHGKALEKLGLIAGTPVTKEAFERLLYGCHPETGKQLAQRLRKDRRPGVDITLSAPKSVSLLWALLKDERIVELLQAAVHETMARDVEPLVCRRLRSGKQAASKDRKATGNFLYADFTHLTSRPVDGTVDPHLHVHCFVQNYTFDGEQVYAAELEELVRQAPALQAAFHARLARKLQEQLGYEMERVRFRQSGRLKTGLQVKGISRATIEKFSRRTVQIEQAALEKEISDPELKGKLGATTREKKQPGQSIAALRSEWQSRLTADEQASLPELQSRAIGRMDSHHPSFFLSPHDERLQVAEEAVRFSLEHHLYRQSTVEQHQVVGTALEHAITCTPEEIEAALERLNSADEVIQGKEDVRGYDRHLVTTREVLEAERRMIAFAREGRGIRVPIGREEHRFERDWLNAQQKNAVRHLLDSRDTVMAVSGRAGVGKSTLMQEAVSAIQNSGKSVHVFAPSTGAVEVLAEKGFSHAKTVEHLLRNEKFHQQLSDSVLWIDEAGLLDTRSMLGIFEIAKQRNCRVVLSGDTRQHQSPRRGASLQLLEREAGLNIAKVETIQRQQGEYKRAVELISRGHEVVDAKRGLTGMLAGFDRLDKLGKIVELAGGERHEALADAYIKAREQRKSTLVVAPTHAEGEAVTAVVRERLREKGAIGEEERQFTQLKSLNWTEAEKTVAANYRDEENLIVQFHQNVKGGYIRGERYRVQTGNNSLPFLAPETGKGPAKPLPLDHPDRFEVYAESQVGLAIGDKVRFTLGGTGINRKGRISNGRLDVVKSFDKQGNLRLESGFSVSKDYGHLAHGICVTSHAAQGKDVDLAIGALGSQSLPAINSKQFYTTASRGREDVLLFVDDKQAVRRAIQRAGEQLSATELARLERVRSERQVRDNTLRHRQYLDRVRRWWQQQLTQSPSRPKSPSPVWTPNAGPGLARS